MNRFTVDFSSSPASERLPDNSPQPQRRNIFSLSDDVASTTPAAPPPSQVFGSSQFGTGVSKLNLTRGSNALNSSSSKSQASQRTKNTTFVLPKSRLYETSTNTYATEEDDQDYTDDMMEEDEDEFEQRASFRPTRDTAPSLLKFSTNSMRQSLQRSTNRRSTGSSRSQLPRTGRYDFIPGLSRDVSRRLGTAKLSESDEVILGTEDLLRGVDGQCQMCDGKAAMQAIVTAAANELMGQFKKGSRYGSASTSQNMVGPDAKSTSFEKAQYLATLLLELHHPVESDNKAKSLIHTDGNRRLQAMPEVLLRWLDHHHVNYAPLFEQVITTTPAPSANDLYWDAIETFTLRGKFEEVMELLKRGDLNHAVIDTPDGSRNANFSGTQLQLAEDAVYRARQLVNTCPAFHGADWNLGGSDWDVYRKQLEAEIEHLADQVTSHEEPSPQLNDPGLFDQASTKSGLPFIVYQRLKTVYSIMLGDTNEIIGLAQDWVEASILLTVWWIPTEDKSVAKWSFDVSRANNTHSNDIDPHLQRLSDSFLCVTDPDSQSALQLNTLDPVEVGLGAVLQGDVQSCFRILRTLSLCAASSVAEIGSLAGWLGSTPISTGLDEEDLMVLNYGSDDMSIKKDDILEDYARALFERNVFHNMAGESFEGWELSFSVLSRLDDQERTHVAIADMLRELPVTDQERAGKLVELCAVFGLEAEGRKVSENFADTIVDSTTEYGTALLCYARAHAEDKVRKVIDLLNSYCLVQSKAYPPEQTMDAALLELVSSPKSALQSISEVDPKSAEILQFYLVGYACIRRYYSLRDDQNIKGSHLRPLARKKAAAKALIAAINSAADSIYGGLYDASRQSAVQVDGLLTLLGEATSLLAHDDERGILSTSQMYALLAAIEDLQTVNDRVYQAAEECMEAALRNYHGSLPPSPHAMLKKSVSSGTNSNFSFSMMGSEMLARSEESLGGKSLGSAVMVGHNKHEEQHQRGWDWRSRFKGDGTSGRDVLKHLRTCIAKELGIMTVEEEASAV